MNEEKINHLNMLEQSLQQFIQQRQAIQAQIIETDNALEEIKNTKETYKLIGNILVKKDSKKLIEELQKEKKELETRSNSIQTQEKQLKERAEKLKNELMGEE